MKVELKSLSDRNRNNVTMIEVAEAVLEEKEDVMHFDDILNQVAEYLDLSDEEIEKYMAIFYADLNIEGSFISLGNNSWGLRRWYPIDAVNEAVTVKNDMESLNPHIASDAFKENFEEEENEDPIVDVELEEGDFDSVDEEETSQEEIKEYEDELSELEVEEDDSLEDEDLSYDDDDLEEEEE